MRLCIDMRSGMAAHGNDRYVGIRSVFNDWMYALEKVVLPGHTDILTTSAAEIS